MPLDVIRAREQVVVAPDENLTAGSRQSCVQCRRPTAVGRKLDHPKGQVSFELAQRPTAVRGRAVENDDQLPAEVGLLSAKRLEQLR